MMKNLFLLGLLAWVSLVYAKHPVAQESMDDAEAFKVENAVEEQDAQRSVAGERIKKTNRGQRADRAHKDGASDGPDFAVRYWEYSEE